MNISKLTGGFQGNVKKMSDIVVSGLGATCKKTGEKFSGTVQDTFEAAGKKIHAVYENGVLKFQKECNLSDELEKTIEVAADGTITKCDFAGSDLMLSKTRFNPEKSESEYFDAIRPEKLKFKKTASATTNYRHNQTIESIEDNINKKTTVFAKDGKTPTHIFDNKKNKTLTLRPDGTIYFETDNNTGKIIFYKKDGKTIDTITTKDQLLRFNA